MTTKLPTHLRASLLAAAPDISFPPVISTKQEAMCFICCREQYGEEQPSNNDSMNVASVFYIIGLIVLVAAIVICILNVIWDPDLPTKFRDAAHWLFLTGSACVAIAIYYMHLTRYALELRHFEHVIVHTIAQETRTRSRPTPGTTITGRDIVDVTSRS